MPRLHPRLQHDLGRVRVRARHAREPDQAPVVALGPGVEVAPAAHGRLPHARVRHLRVPVPEPERLAQHAARPAHVQLPQEGAAQAQAPRPRVHPQHVHRAARVQAAERRQRPRRARLHEHRVVSLLMEHRLALWQQHAKQAPVPEALEQNRNVVQEPAVRLVQLPQHVPQRLRPVRVRRNRKHADLVQIKDRPRLRRLHLVPYARQKGVHCVPESPVSRVWLTCFFHDLFFRVLFYFFAQDRPDLIKSELAGLAFDSLQQVFRKADIEHMFNSEALALVQDQTVWIVIDPAAGGPSSDYAVVSLVRQRGTVTVRLPLSTRCSTRPGTRAQSPARTARSRRRPSPARCAGPAGSARSSPGCRRPCTARAS